MTFILQSKAKLVRCLKLKKCYLLGSTDVGTVDFLGEAQRVERLVREQLARVDVHDHQRL